MITTNASYVPTAAEFNAHWVEVNADLPPTAPLVLRTGLARAAFLALKVELQTVEGTLVSRLNDAEIARGQVRLGKAGLLFWFGRFMSFFEAYFGESALAGARPMAPKATGTMEVFVRPMLDVADLWLRIDAMEGTGEAPPGVSVPVTLTGEAPGMGLEQAGFVALIAALRAQADAEITAEGRAKRSRSRRNFTQERIYEAMKVYRLAMPGALPSGHELQETLPRLTPEETGTTPEPVAASAVYVSGATSKTVYEASAAADLKEYQLRGVVGEVWDEDDAVTIATNGPAEAREFAVAFGLTQPGTKIVLKVYVVTLTGRERGSAAMVVERP